MSHESYTVDFDAKGVWKVAGGSLIALLVNYGGKKLSRAVLGSSIVAPDL